MQTTNYQISMDNSNDTGLAGLGESIAGLSDAVKEFSAAIDRCTYVDWRGYEYNYVRQERIIGPAQLPEDFEEYQDLDDLRRDE